MTAKEKNKKLSKKRYDRQRYLGKLAAATHLAYLKEQRAMHPDCAWCKENLKRARAC